MYFLRRKADQIGGTKDNSGGNCVRRRRCRARRLQRAPKESSAPPVGRHSATFAFLRRSPRRPRSARPLLYVETCFWYLFGTFWYLLVPFCTPLLTFILWYARILCSQIKHRFIIWCGISLEKYRNRSNPTFWSHFHLFWFIQFFLPFAHSPLFFYTAVVRAVIPPRPDVFWNGFNFVAR